MAANDKAIELLIEGQEFLTKKVEENDTRIRALEIGKAAADAKTGIYMAVVIFVAGIIGSLLTHWVTKALWP